MTHEDLRVALVATLLCYVEAKHIDTQLRYLMEIDDIQQRINDLVVTGMTL